MSLDSQSYKINMEYDRELVLQVKEGAKALNTSGLVDSRLFTGGNRLRALMDKQTCLWYLKYDEGLVPPPLRQHFTSFSKLKAFATEYMKKRNINIVDVKENA